MNKNNKKGLIKLICIIAVISILAVVIIISINKINIKNTYNNDIKICNNMNNNLSNNSSIENIIDVKESLNEQGIELIPKSSDFHYYWCEIDNNIYLINDNNTFNVTYPETNTLVTNNNTYRLDKDYYNIICDIEGVSVNKNIVEKGILNVELLFNIKDGYKLPNIVSIDYNEYIISNNKIILESINSNIVIYEFNPLTFTSSGDSSITPKFESGEYWYSTNNGTNWIKGNNDGTTTINLSNGESVIFKGKECTTNYENYFSMTGSLSASGDITSLTNGAGGNIIIPNGSYMYMFRKCSALTNAPTLPSTTLSNNCYSGMFEGCTKLKTAPALPATTLTGSCYSNMFAECTSLISAPVLPATTMEQYCYHYMFYKCTSLINAPELPATTLASSCYSFMFYDCESLIKAPDLPATTLADACYNGMFQYCTSLIQAPELKAKDIYGSSYYTMFWNCNKLRITTDLSIAQSGSSYGIIFGGEKNYDSHSIENMFYCCLDDKYNYIKENPTPSKDIIYYWYISE